MNDYEYYNRIIANIEDCSIILLDKDGIIINWNKGAEKLKGYTSNEIIGKSFYVFYTEDDLKNNVPQKLLEEAIRFGKAFTENWRIKKDGTKFWASVMIHTLKAENSEITGFIKITHDLTVRKKNEEQLLESNKHLKNLIEERTRKLTETENKFKNTLDNMIEGVQIHDFNWNYIYVNKTLERYSGISKENLIGSNLLDVYPNIEKSELFKTLEKCMWERVSMHIDSEFVFPDGRVSYFELSIQPLPEGLFILSIDITEKKKTDEKLQISDKEVSDYKFALDESSIVAVTDQKGIIKHVNQNFCKISKYTEEELLGQDHRIVNSGFHSKKYIKDLWNSIANGNIWKGELKNKAKDGSYYWVDTTIVPFLNDKGKPYKYLAIRSDITERKIGEEKIYKANRLYEFISSINKSIVHINNQKELLEQSCKIAIDIGKFKSVWVALLNEKNELKISCLGGDITDSTYVMKLAGLDLSNKSFDHYPSVEAIKSNKFSFNNDLQNDINFIELKTEFIKHNINSTIAFPLNSNKNTIGIIGFFNTTRNFFDKEEINLLEEAAGDISFAIENYERLRLHKQTEALVENNERKFRALIEKSTDMKTLTNKEGNFIYASPNVLEVFGYTDEEYLNKPAASFFHPDDLEDLIKNREKLLDTPGESYFFQYRTKHKNGHWVWCEGSITNMLDEPGVNAMVSNFKDITERKEVEKILEFNLNNLNALINNTNDLLWSIDKDYNLITFNQPFYNAIYKRYNVKINSGINALTIGLTETEKDYFTTLYNRALMGETFTETLYNKEKKETWNEISFYPLKNDSFVIGTACFSRNITNRVLADREREEMIADIIQRNKNFEQFAYIVSHNLRAPVANILGISEVLKSDLPIKERIKTQNFLFDGIRNLDEIVKDLNKILRTKTEITESRELINLSDIIVNIESSINNLIDKDNVKINVDFTKVNQIVSLKSYIQSIFYNLISNSIKYRRSDISPVITIKSHVENNKLIVVYKDNGRGIDLEKYHKDVFGLYKRFHKNIEGKGLGLFMVRTQLEVLGGTIHIESEVDSFTEFTIQIPLESKN